MNIEEMIQHLYVAESIVDHMATIADAESPRGIQYTNAAEIIGGLILDLERLDSAMKEMTETTEAAAPAEQPTDKGLALPPYSLPPREPSPYPMPPYIMPNPKITYGPTITSTNTEQS